MNMLEMLGMTEEEWLASPQWKKDAAYRIASGEATDIDRLLIEPELLFTKVGMTPDPWQLQCLRSERNLMLNISRQAGKSFLTSSIALLYILVRAPSLVIIISPSERQSGELMNDKRDKLQKLYEPWSKLCPLIKDNEGEKTFANGSRIVALPGKSDANIRGYSGVSLLIMDEASRVPDSIYGAITPVVAVSNGRMIALSTPYGKRGWFYNEWEKGKAWEKIRVPADMVPRLVKASTPDGYPLLKHERESKGDRLFAQEFMCDFSMNVGSVFREEDIAAITSRDFSDFGNLAPLDFEEQPHFIETVALSDKYKIEMN